jgi:hypothetical protein
LIAQLVTILVTAFIPADQVSQVLSSFTTPIGFVLLGTRTAPVHKLYVAAVLAILMILATGTYLGWASLGVNGGYETWVIAISIPLGVIGALLAVFIVYRQERPAMASSGLAR